jgi:hypothetical protein
MYHHKPGWNRCRMRRLLAMELRTRVWPTGCGEKGGFTARFAAGAADGSRPGAAHRVGVDRDFKTQNVMLVKPTAPEQEVRVVITDWPGPAQLARRSYQSDERRAEISARRLHGARASGGGPDTRR